VDLSTFFKLERGVRQGDSISALLYLFVVETLANAIRKEEKIRGINKWSGYADDSTLTVVYMNSIECAFSVLRIYEKASDAKVNYDKTEALWLGSNRGRTDRPLDINWKNDVVKVLGIHLGNIDTKELNWRLDKLKIKLMS